MTDVLAFVSQPEIFETDCTSNVHFICGMAPHHIAHVSLTFWNYSYVKNRINMDF